MIQNEIYSSLLYCFGRSVAHSEHMLFLCSIEFVLKSPVSLRVNVLLAIERLNIDCHTTLTLITVEWNSLRFRALK